ncbi:MAG: hypothetical protein WCM76_02965 [Bacteroidota bacterium]
MKTNVFLACLFAFLKTTAVVLISFWLLMLLSNDIIHADRGETYLAAFFLTIFLYPPTVLVYVVAFLLPGYYILKKHIPDNDWYSIFRMLIPFSMLLVSLIVFLIFISISLRDFTEPLMLINIICGYLFAYSGAIFFSRNIYQYSHKI